MSEQSAENGLPHVPTENSGECATCYEAWPCPSAENDVLHEASRWLRGVSEKCCECTDGHHEQQYAYGTESDVRISRDTARALADLLNNVAGAQEQDVVAVERDARAVARGLLTGCPIPPGGCGICGKPLSEVGTSRCYEAHGVIPPGGSDA